MTKAIISDFSGNTIKDSLAYTVKIYSHGNKTHLEADMGFDMPLKTLVESFLANGCKWFKLEKQEDEVNQVHHVKIYGWNEEWKIKHKLTKL